MSALASHIAFTRRLIVLLDTKFSLFGIKFVIDPLLDIIPGFGSFLGSAFSCYLFWLSYRLKVPAHVYFHMAWNMGVDYLLGLIPFVGIVADVLYRSNVKNFALLETFVDSEILEGELIDR